MLVFRIVNVMLLADTQLSAFIFCIGCYFVVVVAAAAASAVAAAAAAAAAALAAVIVTALRSVPIRSTVLRDSCKWLFIFKFHKMGEIA
jgi:uncharacterized membrane protein